MIAALPARALMNNNDPPLALIRLPPSMSLTEVPEVKLMDLCSSHRNALTAQNFPQKNSVCGCRIDRYVMALFTAVKEGSSVEACVFPGAKPAAAKPAATPKQQSLTRGGDGATAEPEAGAGKSKSALQRARRAVDKSELAKFRAGTAAPTSTGTLAKPQGGSHDMIKGDFKADTFAHVRIGPQSFGNGWAMLAYRLISARTARIRRCAPGN